MTRRVDRPDHVDGQRIEIQLEARIHWHLHPPDWDLDTKHLAGTEYYILEFYEIDNK